MRTHTYRGETQIHICRPPANMDIFNPCAPVRGAETSFLKQKIQCESLKGCVGGKKIKQQQHLNICAEISAETAAFPDREHQEHHLDTETIPQVTDTGDKRAHMCKLSIDLYR